MDMKNWNVDKTQIAAQQEALKKSMNFAYVGHGPKATGFMAKQFKRKPGLYARCVQCGYYMPLDAKGEEIELKDDDEDTYQPDRIRDDDFYGYNAGGESDFAAAGFTLKEGSDDDDLAVADDTDDADEDVGFEEEIVLDDSTDDGDLD